MTSLPPTRSCPDGETFPPDATCTLSTWFSWTIFACSTARSMVASISSPPNGLVM